MSTRTPEGNIQKQILDYLKRLRIYAWRNNTRSIFMGGHRYQYGKKGSSDILGILPGGRFLAIEVKVPGEKPTPEQLEFLDAINSAGGLGLVAYSLEDAIARLSVS